MPNCANCKHWPGDDSTYRAKCALLSTERENVATLWSDVCSGHQPREVAPPIDMQSQARGNFTTTLGVEWTIEPYAALDPNNRNTRYIGCIRKAFIADEYGDLIDTDMIDYTWKMKTKL